jgi:hypothetical protein
LLLYGAEVHQKQKERGAVGFIWLTGRKKCESNRLGIAVGAIKRLIVICYYAIRREDL